MELCYADAPNRGVTEKSWCNFNTKISLKKKKEKKISCPYLFPAVGCSAYTQAGMGGNRHLPQGQLDWR